MGWGESRPDPLGVASGVDIFSTLPHALSSQLGELKPKIGRFATKKD